MHNWHIEAICEHLEAVSRGEITRLIINVPFRTMKSTLVSVMWPAWVWTWQPEHQFLTGSHAEKLAIRDNVKHRRLVQSRWYQERWGRKFGFTADQNQKTRFENDQSGYRIAFGMTGGVTGDGGDTLLIDDPLDRKQADSEVERDNANTTFDETLVSRLNEPEHSAIVVIMQRLNEDDLSGHLLSDTEDEWEHLMLPMEYEPERHCSTGIGFSDPRKTDGELLWPERFPAHVVESLKRTLGPYGTAGQLQQSPKARGGSILKRDYWQLWEDEKYPAFEFVLVSADTAFTSKEENDPAGVAVLGIFRDKQDRPRVMLMWGWAKRCELHGRTLEKKPGETKKAYDIRSMPTWGLVEWIAYTCRRFKADKLLVENKASGLDVVSEMNRLYSEDAWSVHLVNPNKDKVARAHSVEPAFAAGLIYAPDEDWAEKFIAECEVFPKGKHDDRVDAVTQGVKWMRENGLIEHNFETAAELRDAMEFRPEPKALYDV